MLDVWLSVGGETTGRKGIAMSETRKARLDAIRADAEAIADADYCHVAKWGEEPRDYQHTAEQVLWMLDEIERLEADVNQWRNRWKEATEGVEA